MNPTTSTWRTQIIYINQIAFHYSQQQQHFIYTALMIVSLRKKDSFGSTTQTLTPNHPIDQSFAESNVSRRFARTKNSSNDHNKSARQVKPHITLLQKKSASKQKEREMNLSTNYIKTEDLFLKISQTPNKNKTYFAPISSDRATQSTYIKQRCQTEAMPFNCMTTGKQTYAQMRSQLQLKNGELMLLEDEVMRLKREIIGRQQQLIKSNIRKQKQHQAQLLKLREEIKLLQQQIQSKNNQIKQFKKTQTNLNRQIKSLKYDKVVLEKHIEEVYKMRLPKQLKELISFRQISLAKQIQQLKLKLGQSKSQSELNMEQQIRKLKEENNSKIANLKKLQVHTRIMNRKMMECENELKQKTQNFSKYYLSMKQSQNDLLDQLKKARKQNIKLRRLHILSHSHPSKKLVCSSSESSLNLSLSSSNN